MGVVSFPHAAELAEIRSRVGHSDRQQENSVSSCRHLARAGAEPFFFLSLSS